MLTVALKNASDSLLSRGAITDMDGNFEMGGVEAENYFIECSYIGYEHSTVKSFNTQVVIWFCNLIH
ncbi:MAG: hypothetical protein IPL23_13035 [Saprospiraceae bacterium]|nr:hypothetical protein [Saprospiraceae bacterium]